MFETLFYEHCDSFADESHLVPSFNKEFDKDDNDVEYKSEVVFTDEEFNLILNNRYETYGKVPFDTESEWKNIMEEASTIIENETPNDNDAFDSECEDDDEFYYYD